MTELVLTISRQDLFKQAVTANGGVDGIYSADLELLDQFSHKFLDRAILDNKSPAAILLGDIQPQLIGYFQIKDTSGRILTYRRKGKEGGLLGKYSIGVGGHIDQADAETVVAKNNSIYADLVSIYRESCVREIKEEVGLSVAHKTFKTRTNLLATNVDPTSTVHVGLVQDIVVTDINALNYCENEFQDVRWHTPAELKALSTELEFETWTKILIENM